MQGSNLYLAKAWFHSSQPMTRSRSSELRRRYEAMQSSQMATISQAPNNTLAHGANKVQIDFTNSYNFHDIQMGETPNQMHPFMSPSSSSTSFNATPVAAADTVSSVVSMLRGTLERKRLNSIGEKEMMEGSSYRMFGSHEGVLNLSPNHGLGSQVVGPPTSFHMGSSHSRVEKSLDLSMEGFLTQANQVQTRAASQEPSQSESSTAVPALSTGFEVCDGPANSGHTLSNGMCSSRHVHNGASDHELKSTDYGDRVFGNSFKDATKKVNLVRMGSISSTASEDKSDPTKKRRVERSRKMAEAKEKSSTAPIPANMQSVLKRCENLEKEVRSLKLNLSFMNRKDSDQTKQIEELQNQNDELVNEKRRLLEEIERIISNPGKM